MTRGIPVTVLVALALTGCTPSVQLPFAEPAAAVVDGHAISIKAYQARLQVSRQRDPFAGIEMAIPSPAPARRLEDFTIDQLIREQIVIAEAGNHGISVSPSTAETRITRLRQRAGAAPFAEALSRNGFTASSFKDYQRALLTEVSLVEKMARDRARSAEQALAAGDSFAQVAAAWSDDPGSFARGGEAGWVRPADLPELELAAAVQKLEPGERSGVIRTDRGFVFLRVVERQADKAHLNVILVLAPTVDLYTPDSRPAWFDRFIQARYDALAGAGKIEVKVGSAVRG
jgi:parvulin-like peptidyl-prolyl isomerase